MTRKEYAEKKGITTVLLREEEMSFLQSEGFDDNGKEKRKMLNKSKWRREIREVEVFYLYENRPWILDEETRRKIKKNLKTLRTQGFEGKVDGSSIEEMEIREAISRIRFL